MVSRLNAGISSGLRLDTSLPSTTTSWSTYSAPAFLRSVLSDGHAAPLAEMLASLGVPFALTTAHDCSEQDEPVLRGVPCVPKPYGSRQLYRALIDLLGPEPETLEPV